MKFNLKKDLLDNRNTVMSHVLISTIQDTELKEKLIAKAEELTQEEFGKLEVDIKLLIDGEEFNTQKFFDMIWSQFQGLVHIAAQDLFNQEKCKNNPNIDWDDDHM